MKPKAKIKDIKRARYLKHNDGIILVLSVEKNGATGAIRFGTFENKAEAKDFYKELKKVK